LATIENFFRVMDFAMAQEVNGGGHEISISEG